MIKYYESMVLEFRIKITSFVLYVINIFLTISIVIGSILLIIYSDVADPLFLVRLVIFSLFWWGYYLWFNQSKRNGNSLFFQNTFALFGLIMVVFLGITLQMNPLNEWIFLLIYPFIIFYLLDERIFLLWIFIYILVFNLYIIFENLEHFDRNVQRELFFTENFYLAFVCVLGWIGSQSVNRMVKQFSIYRFKRHKERMFQILNSFVPLIEQRYFISRDEIYKASNLMKELCKDYPEFHYEWWEIDLLSLVSYVSRIFLSDQMIEIEYPIKQKDQQIISEIRHFSYDLLSDLEEFQRIRDTFLYTLKTEVRNSEKDEDKVILSEILKIVEDLMELTRDRKYKGVSITEEEALIHLRKCISLRYREEIYNKLSDIILKGEGKNHTLG